MIFTDKNNMESVMPNMKPKFIMKKDKGIFDMEMFQKLDDRLKL